MGLLVTYLLGECCVLSCLEDLWILLLYCNDYILITCKVWEIYFWFLHVQGHCRYAAIMGHETTMLF